MTGRTPRRWASSLLALVPLACGAPDAPPEPVPALEPAAPRVVSLSPAATAFAVDLGAGPALVAVDPASARLVPDVARLPIVGLGDAAALRVDLVLAPPLDADGAAVARALRAAGTDVVEIAPRDYDGVFALCRTLGVRLAGPVRAAAFESALGRELAGLAAESRGRRRPRVAAVTSVDPFELAPAHGFATDLIELAGGMSAAHDSAHDPHASLRVSTPAELAATAPDLVLVLSAAPLAQPARAAARAALGDDLSSVEFVALDEQRFWVRDGGAAVRRFRTAIDRHRGRAPR